MKKIFFTLFILCLSFSNLTISYSQPASDKNTQNSEGNPTELPYQLNIMADSAILIDATTGKILYEKQMDKKQYPASITKLMTVLLALEYGKLEETMTFSKEAVFGIERNSSHIAIDVGEQITIEQGLYAIMLQSANEVSLGVAEHIRGSKEEFSKLMTTRAEELGCKNTNFENPNGLHAENHYTSAYDMALIAKELIKFDKFKDVASTTYYEIPPTNKQEETRYLYSQHKMINKNSKFYYEGCLGGKTGFTNEALNTLVTYAQRGDTELIAVVLYDPGTGIYTDTKTLLDYGFENYETVKAFSAVNFSKTIPVFQTYEKDSLDAGDANVAAEEDIYVTLPKNTPKTKLEEKVICSDSLKTPVELGSKVGSLQIYYDNEVVGETNLVSKTSVAGIPEEEIKSNKKKELLKFVPYILVAIMVILIIIKLIEQAYIEKQRRLRRRRFKQKYKSDRRY